MIESRRVVTLVVELHETIKIAIDVLNNIDGVEVGTPFWVSTVES